MDMLFKLCEVLDCDLGYLLGQEDYKDVTLLRTSIENATGLTPKSLDTIIGIKNGMVGAYLPALNKLLSDKGALLSILIPLTRLEKLEQEKARLRAVRLHATTSLKQLISRKIPSTIRSLR